MQDLRKDSSWKSPTQSKVLTIRTFRYRALIRTNTFKGITNKVYVLKIIVKVWIIIVFLQVKGDYEEETNSAASFLIREWVEKLLGVKFNSLRDLAVYLIEKMYVDNRSTAAYTVITAMKKSGEGKKISRHGLILLNL